MSIDDLRDKFTRAYERWALSVLGPGPTDTRAKADMERLAKEIDEAEIGEARNEKTLQATERP